MKSFKSKILEILIKIKKKTLFFLILKFFQNLKPNLKIRLLNLCSYFIISYAISYPIILTAKNSIETPPKCATSLKNNEKISLIEEYCQLQDKNGRCVMQNERQSPSGRFLIHYDTTGLNAVDKTDLNNDGIPDYVDSVAYYFDQAWSIEVDSMGYNAPENDRGFGGSNAYDVYLVNLGRGEGYYGFTIQEILIEPPNRYTSYIVIDNDFSPLDSISLSSDKKLQSYHTYGIEAVKITSAHEFHHAIQYNYNEPGNRTIALMEMTSVWFEYRLHPEVKDYYFLVDKLFKNLGAYPFGNGSDRDVGYCYGIFGQYLHKNYGDSLLLRMWQIIGSKVNAYSALNLALNERGGSLAQDWKEFMPWLYFTGSRTINTKYFEDAKDFGMITFNATGAYNYPAFTISGVLQPYEIRAFRCLLPKNVISTDDTLDVILCNQDLASALASVLQTKPFVVTVNREANQTSEQIYGTEYYFLLNDIQGDINDTTFINAGFDTQIFSYPYPNPYNPIKDFELLLPAPESAPAQADVQLDIFNVEMQSIISQNIKVEIRENNRVIVCNSINSGCKDGIYFYKVSFNGSEKFGKFAVINKP